jgi:hypothetical protein
MLNASSPQSGKPIELERAVPGEELVIRQLVDLAGFPDRELAPAHDSNHRRFATHYPSFGVGVGQTFSEQCLTRRFVKRRRHLRGEVAKLKIRIGDAPPLPTQWRKRPHFHEPPVLSGAVCERSIRPFVFFTIFSRSSISGQHFFQREHAPLFQSCFAIKGLKMSGVRNSATV